MNAVRSLVVLVAVAVACSLLAVATLASGAAAQDGGTEIDSCTTITESGLYELTADIQSDEADSCIEVRSSDVVIEGNGHTVAGPGTVDATDTVVAGVYVNDTDAGDSGSGEYENVTLRNVEIDGWDAGIRVGQRGHGGSYLTVENAVVRGSETGIRHHGSTLTLTGVTVENNDGGIYARHGGVEGTDVTVRDNGGGIGGWDGHFQLTASSVVNNEGNGATLQHHSSLDLTDVTLNGNSDHGIYAMSRGFRALVEMEGGTIADNGGDGVHVWGDWTDIRLDGVTIANNDGLEVNGAHEDRGDGNVTASDVRVGQSATTTFEAEPIRLEPVDREALPAREGGTAAGDGLNVSGPIEGPVDLELDVETDDDAVDLWRHDGDQWETVEEDLPVTDGTVEATVEQNGTYAPGTDDGDGDPSTIDSCTAITEPGEYELVADIQSDEPEACIEIQADDVTIDGNGHVVEGPGADGDGIGIDVGSDGDNRGLEVRNVEIAGWDQGVYAGGNYELADAVVRDNRIGLEHDQGGAEQLTNVTVENNDVGIFSMMGGARGSDVTVRENGRGIKGQDGGNYYLESSRIVDNDEYGASVQHSSELNLTDSTVSGNGGHGLYLPHYGYSSQAHIENTTVSDNGGDGIRTSGSSDSDHVRLESVTLENNDGLELNAISNDDEEFTMPVTATDLDVGPSATTAFEAESLRLEPVARETLPARDGGTAAGDGLNVSGAVDGTVDLELDVETDDDTVDLWRYDGSQWKTVEEDLAVTGGTVEATVERNGTYAPGTDDEPQDGSGDESGGSEDDSDGTEDDTDGSDDPQDDSDGTGDGTQDGTDGDDDSDGAAGGSDGTGDDTQDDTDGSEGTGDGTDGSDGTGDGAQDGGAGAGGGADDSGDTGESSDGGDAGAGDGSGASGDDEESGADDSGDGGQDDAGPSGDDAGGSGDGGQDGSSASTSSASGTSGSSGSGGSSDSGGSADSDGSANGGTTGPSGATATPYPTDVEPSDADGATETVTPTDTEESESGVAQADEEDDGVETEDDGVSLADGPGFGPLVVLLALALFAMVAVILVVQRQA